MKQHYLAAGLSAVIGCALLYGCTDTLFYDDMLYSDTTTEETTATSTVSQTAPLLTSRIPSYNTEALLPAYTETTAPTDIPDTTDLPDSSDSASTETVTQTEITVSETVQPTDTGTRWTLSSLGSVTLQCSIRIDDFLVREADGLLYFDLQGMASALGYRPADPNAAPRACRVYEYTANGLTVTVAVADNMENTLTDSGKSPVRTLTCTLRSGDEILQQLRLIQEAPARAEYALYDGVTAVTRDQAALLAFFMEQKQLDLTADPIYYLMPSYLFSETENGTDYQIP